MRNPIRRREFITLLGGAAAAWPLVARGQRPAMPVIGYLHSGSPEPNAIRAMSLRKGLSEMGFVEGRNLSIEYRWAENHFDRLPQLAADLVRREVAVIVTTPASTLAAKAATTTIPIVFMGGTDPVQIGLVSNFSRPGGNVTGIAAMSGEIIGKLLGLLHELVPNATRFAAIVNPNSPVKEAVLSGLRSAASLINSEIDFLTAATVGEIDEAFTKLVNNRTEALLVSPGNFLASRRVQLATLAARHRVPVVYPERGFSEVGGLMSYGANVADEYRQVGLYVGRILKGEKPADLPVMQPTKFEFVINLTTARTLGIEVPPKLLAIADEVIE